MKQTERLIFGTILMMAALISGFDLVADYNEGASEGHLVLEAALFLGSIVAVAYLLRSWWDARKSLQKTGHRLRETRADFKALQIKARPYLEGLGKVIEAQFVEWVLSPAEKEIGLLILKGLSFKEIAFIRKTSERTVRQQARAIYAKARLAGRVEFGAFFLEDLLLPCETEKQKSAKATPET